MASTTGRRGSATSTALGIVLVAAILVLVNVISAGTFTRLDLTEGKEFTISRATKDIVGDLNDLVTVTVYMTTDLPTQLATLRREISDILDEYRNYGRGNVQVEFVDPADNPELQQRLRTLGIPQITAQTLEKDQFQSVNIYLGMAVSYLDREEAIPVVQDTYTLEYDLTSAILKVSGENEYVLGVLSGPTEHNLTNHMTSVRELLQRQFTIRSVDLKDGSEPVPEDVDLLIVAGPSSVPDRVQYQIDQYLMRGGRLIVMVDGIKLPEGGGLQANPVESGIEDLLAHYGVRVQKALVLDQLNATASFSSGYVRYTLPYPYWVKAVPDLLNSENPVTNRLESVVFPWASPLELDVPIGPGDPLARIHALEEVERERARQMGLEIPDDDSTAVEGAEMAEAGSAAPVTASVLSRTSPRSWRVAGYYDLNPQQRFAPTGETAPEITAVALSGQFASFYNDNEVPAPEEPGQDEEALAAVPAELIPTLTSPETQMLVIGNAQFATDQFLAQYAENTIFLLNAVDWMTLGDQLISIRSRGATNRPLKEVSDTAKSTAKLACILGTPLLVIVYGLARFTIRRKAAATREIELRAE